MTKKNKPQKEPGPQEPGGTFFEDWTKVVEFEGPGFEQYRLDPPSGHPLADKPVKKATTRQATKPRPKRVPKKG
jgi:hypothetical protein